MLQGFGLADTFKWSGLYRLDHFFDFLDLVNVVFYPISEIIPGIFSEDDLHIFSRSCRLTSLVLPASACSMDSSSLLRLAVVDNR